MLLEEEKVFREIAMETLNVFQEKVGGVHLEKVSLLWNCWEKGLLKMAENAYFHIYVIPTKPYKIQICCVKYKYIFCEEKLSRNVSRCNNVHCTHTIQS